MLKGQKPSWLFALVVGYTALFATWLLLRLVFFDHYWPLALVNTFAEYYFLPLPFLIIAAGLYKKWRWLIPLALPAITFAIMFGGVFLPTLPANTSDSDLQLTATTFNVLWENTDYAAIAQAIHQNAPDLIGMEELHPNNFDGIVSALAADYPYHAPKPEAPSGGVGLFSRYPIESADPFELPPRNLTLHAVVNVQGQRIHVFVVHLSPNNFFGYPSSEWIPMAEERYASRASETAQLKAMIEAMTEPVVLLCDCNLSDTSQAYAILASFLIDSHSEVGWGFGHTWMQPPYDIPVQRMDYVWHNNAFVANSIQIGPNGGSDHLPVTAKLNLINRP